MKLMSLTFLALIGSTLGFTTVHADSWNGANDPSNFEKNYEYKMSALPVKGFIAAAKMPWSETYWPSQKGSINYRWHSKNPVGFDYGSPSREMVKSMTQEQLAELSPSEKYDIYMGHYDYPLKTEVSWSAKKSAKDWAGICHGWSPAALQYVEPKAVVLTNPDGVQIPFGASDVKGLLSYFMAFHAELGVTQVGKRCMRLAEILGRDSCSDINPGAMHVILGNELGMHQTGFVADVDSGHEVWNQPVYGYETQIVGSAYSNGPAVHVKTKMYYTDELETSEWEPVTGTDKFKFKTLDMEYYLELDGQGQIVGGEWIGDSPRPDFMWKAHQEAKFDDMFSGMTKVYQAVR